MSARGNELDLLTRYAIVPMDLDHLDEVRAIEQASYTNPWPHDAFRHEIEENAFSRPRVAVTMDAPGRVAGYCVSWIVFENVSIQNIAVHPGHRRRGIARLLMRRALDDGRSRGAVTAQLEVRASNREARRLYASLGFHETGERKDYYSHPREKAVLLQTSLSKR